MPAPVPEAARRTPAPVHRRSRWRPARRGRTRSHGLSASTPDGRWTSTPKSAAGYLASPAAPVERLNSTPARLWRTLAVPAWSRNHSPRSSRRLGARATARASAPPPPRVVSVRAARCGQRVARCREACGPPYREGVGPPRERTSNGCRRGVGGSSGGASNGPRRGGLLLRASGPYTSCPLTA